MRRITVLNSLGMAVGGAGVALGLTAEGDMPRLVLALACGCAGIGCAIVVVVLLRRA